LAAAAPDEAPGRRRRAAAPSPKLEAGEAELERTGAARPGFHGFPAADGGERRWRWSMKCPPPPRSPDLFAVSRGGAGVDWRRQEPRGGRGRTPRHPRAAPAIPFRGRRSGWRGRRRQGREVLLFRDPRGRRRCRGRRRGGVQQVQSGVQGLRRGQVVRTGSAVPAPVSLPRRRRRRGHKLRPTSPPLPQPLPRRPPRSAAARGVLSARAAHGGQAEGKAGGPSTASLLAVAPPALSRWRRPPSTASLMAAAPLASSRRRHYLDA
jgi:hypothetical protein